MHANIRTRARAVYILYFDEHEDEVEVRGVPLVVQDLRAARQAAEGRGALGGRHALGRVLPGKGREGGGVVNTSHEKDASMGMWERLCEPPLTSCRFWRSSNLKPTSAAS